MTTDSAEKPLGLSDRALEMVMRDVLDGLQELALETALRSGARDCHIAAIEPPQRGARPQPEPKPAEVVDLFEYKRAAGYS